MSRMKLAKEQLELIERQLREAGVATWTVRPTKGNHVSVDFYRDGKKLSFTFSPSSDWKARLRNRTTLRRILQSA